MSDEDLLNLTDWDDRKDPDPIDRLASIRAGEEGANRALQNARPELVRAAEEAIEELNATRSVWTLDDVWILLKDIIFPGEERRFLGSVIKKMKKRLGFRSLKVGKSVRVASHGGHMTVYLSSVNKDWSTASDTAGPYVEKAKKVSRIWDAQRAVNAVPNAQNLKELDDAHIDHSKWAIMMDGLEDDVPVA